MKNFIQQIFSVKNEQYHKVICLLGIKIKLRTGYPHSLKYLEVDIVDHCNLNCSGCSHFCPVTEPNFMNVEEFKRDLTELATKFPIIKQFRLLGGEPLLHPDINKFIQYSREILPCTDIRIVTNGLLLEKMPDEFWNTVNKYNIILDLSKYPIAGEKFAAGLDKIGEKGAKLGFIHLCKKFWLSLISDGSADKTESFEKCNHKNCKSLKNGKLYNCPTGAFIYRYNKKFNTNIPEECGIDIYKSTIDEIEIYMKTPFDTCKYCLIQKFFKYKNWSVSKKDKDEWFADKIKEEESINA